MAYLNERLGKIAAVGLVGLLSCSPFNCNGKKDAQKEQESRPVLVENVQETQQTCRAPPTDEELEKYGKIGWHWGIVSREGNIDYVIGDLCFDGESHRGDIVLLLDGRNIKGVRNSKYQTASDIEEFNRHGYPLKSKVLEYMAAIGSAPFDVYIMPDVKEKIEKSAFLRTRVGDLLLFSLLDNGRAHYLKKGSKEEQILEEGNPMDLLPKEPQKYIFTPPMISEKK